MGFQNHLCISFDDEDTMTPAECGMDDVSLRLADILAEVGARACFNLTGDKVRSLEQRGRRDVIAAIARHSIGSHTSQGSHHPMVAEILAGHEWEEAVRRCHEDERGCLADIRRVFGKEAELLHGHALRAVPPTVIAAGRLGKMHTDGPILWADRPRTVRAPSEDYDATSDRWCGFSWWCNTLCVSLSGPGERVIESSGLDELIRFWAAEFDRKPVSCNHPVMRCLSLGHPMVYLARSYENPSRFFGTDQYWSLNGRELPSSSFGKWGVPDLRSKGEMERIYSDFRRFVAEAIGNRVVWTAPAEVARKFSWQPERIDLKRLLMHAEMIASKKEIVADDIFSAAEVTVGFAQAIRGFAETGKLPEDVERVPAIGPTRSPVAGPEVRELNWRTLVGLARWVESESRTHSALPANAIFGEDRVGIGAVYEAFARVVLDLQAGRRPDRVEMDRVFPRVPRIGIEMAHQVLGSEEGALYDPEMGIDHIYRWTKLQGWSVKRAIYRE